MRTFSVYLVYNFLFPLKTFPAGIVMLPVHNIFEEFYLRVQLMACHLESQNGHINLNAKKIIILTNSRQYLEHLNHSNFSNYLIVIKLLSPVDK